jgi:hypothetical protein
MLGQFASDFSKGAFRFALLGTYSSNKQPLQIAFLGGPYGSVSH